MKYVIVFGNEGNIGELGDVCLMESIFGFIYDVIRCYGFVY